MTDAKTPPREEIVSWLAGRVLADLRAFEVEQQLKLTPAQEGIFVVGYFRGFTFGREVGDVAPVTPALKCEWCENEAAYSINWECGHASAMCVLCFEPSDVRDWTMDIMDWSMEPARCPSCEG